MAFVGANASSFAPLRLAGKVSICPAQSLQMDQKTSVPKEKGFLFDSRKMIHLKVFVEGKIFHIYIYTYDVFFFLGGGETFNYRDLSTTKVL